MSGWVVITEVPVYIRDRGKGGRGECGLDNCAPAYNISLNPFLQILVRDHKRFRLDGFCTTYSLQYIWCVPTLPLVSPSPPSSLTYVHRSIGYHNPTCHSLSKSARLTYLCVYDIRDTASSAALSLSPPSSLTYLHRCIGYHNPTWHSLSKSARLRYLSVYDIRDNDSESVLSLSPPSSLTPNSHMYTTYNPTPSPRPPS
jgi:hypothetical protein